MEITKQELRKLGFKQKGKNKAVQEVHVEISRKNYISISIEQVGNGWIFSTVNVEGMDADVVRKKYFTKFSMKEIMRFLNEY